MLLGEGDWAKVPASSQLFLDIRHRLIFMYQYHADYYFADTEVDQEYLKVEYPAKFKKKIYLYI